MTLPDARTLSAQYSDFVEDLRTTLASFLDAGRSDADIKAIFRSATAAHTVFSAFGDGGQNLLLAAGGIARRCAVLAIGRQLSLARVELRRMIECVVWYVYFLDHPVEWVEFSARPGRGWGDRPQAPIAAAASAATGTFFAYAKERLQGDPSTLGKAAVDRLHVQFGNLSAEVHAAMGAVHPSGSLALAFDRYDRSRIAKLRREIQQVFSASVIVCAAVDRRLLAKLDAVGRAWFDWLVSAPPAKIIRGRPFGVPR